MVSSAEACAVAVVVAGGTGERIGFPGGKQMLPVLGEPLLAHTVRAFERARSVRRIVLVCHPDRVDEYNRAVVHSVRPTKPLVVASGGITRPESVAAGLSFVEGELFTAVHDGARPLITSRVIDDVVTAIAEGPADIAGLVVGHPSYDTLKVIDADGFVTVTPDRGRFWVAQTPQVFRTDVLLAAYDAARASGFVGTDDASFVEALGERVAVFEGPRENIKVTVESDVGLVEAILASRRGVAP